MIKKLPALCLVLLSCAVLTASCSNSTNDSPPSKEELPVFPVTIDLLGSKYEAFIDSQGSLENGIQITSADGSVSLSIGRHQASG